MAGYIRAFWRATCVALQPLRGIEPLWGWVVTVTAILIFAGLLSSAAYAVVAPQFDSEEWSPPLDPTQVVIGTLVAGILLALIAATKLQRRIDELHEPSFEVKDSVEFLRNSTVAIKGKQLKGLAVFRKLLAELSVRCAEYEVAIVLVDMAHLSGEQFPDSDDIRRALSGFVMKDLIGANYIDRTIPGTNAQPINAPRSHYVYSLTDRGKAVATWLLAKTDSAQEAPVKHL